MLRYILPTQSKQHPIALGLLALYTVVWVVICYATYRFLIDRDADSINNMMFYWYVGFCVPYLASNILLVYHGPQQYRVFYKEMAGLISIPMIIVILVLFMHAVIRYANMGVS